MQQLAYNSCLFTKPILTASKPPIRWLVFYVIHVAYRFAGNDAGLY